jgi:hypothetical protein
LKALKVDKITFEISFKAASVELVVLYEIPAGTKMKFIFTNFKMQAQPSDI